MKNHGSLQFLLGVPRMVQQTSLTLLDRLKDPANLKDWELFVTVYAPFIAQKLRSYSISAHDAEDLSQETLAATFRALQDFDHNGRPGAFRAWLKKIIHQRALYFLRSRGRQPVVASAVNELRLDGFASHEDEDDAWEKEHDRYVLNRFLALIRPEFTESTWHAFQLQVIDHQTPKEVSEKIGLSLNAVMIAKSRVMTRLRNLSSGLINDGVM